MKSEESSGEGEDDEESKSEGDEGSEDVMILDQEEEEDEPPVEAVKVDKDKNRIDHLAIRTCRSSSEDRMSLPETKVALSEVL